ncbi:MAG TPA: hypothetical protein GX531_03335 [Methanothermobacter sp.]|nr:hypothetical protein [Methanothermobacter sp.]
MSKSLDIVMAGIISGIVAYTTSQLGIAGTVIGAIIGSMLYQLMTHFFQKPIDNVDILRTRKVESSVFYVFPLIIILGIEILYLFSSFYHTFDVIFQSLETATGWNLFRTIGVGLLVMGVYPILEPDRISAKYGPMVLAVGLVKLMIGFVDFQCSFVNFYLPLFQQFNEIISIMLIAVLMYVIVSIIQDSMSFKRSKDQNNSVEVESDK